jgi:Zn-dependent protease
LRFPFVIHRSGWILVAALIFCGVRDLGFREAIPGSALVILSLLVHEGAHVLAAFTFKVPVSEVGINLIGAYTRRRHASCRLHEVTIASAGPLASILLIVALFFVPRIGPWLAAWNLAIAVLNLAPFPATDGHRILKTIFWSSSFGVPKVLRQRS